MARGVQGDRLVKFNMMIPESLRDWLREEAAEKRMSMADIMVRALERMKGEKG